MTVVESKMVGLSTYYREIMGRSTETKPLAEDTKLAGYNLADNSIFVETDTGDAYVYSTADDAWTKFGGV